MNLRTLFRLISLAVVLLTVALVSALVTMKFAVHGREVAVPQFVGMKPADAQRVASAHGLALQVSRHFFSPNIPLGSIMSQAPEAGTLVRRGWQVQAAESLGPQRVAIPDVTGESLRAVQINLRQRGLELGDQATAELADTPPGVVAAQDPPPNSRDVSAPKVSVLISSPGTAPAYVMPDFTGQAFAIVSHDLIRAGFKVGGVTLQQPQQTAGTGGNALPAAGQTATMIVSQTPGAGEKVMLGSAVNFVVTR